MQIPDRFYERLLEKFKHTKYVYKIVRIFAVIFNLG